MDIVRFIQRLRMHGVLLSLIMNPDQRLFSAEFGYKRSTGLCETWEKDNKNMQVEEPWNKAEQHRNLEQEVLKGVRKFIKEKQTMIT